MSIARRLAPYAHRTSCALSFLLLPFAGACSKPTVGGDWILRWGSSSLPGVAAEAADTDPSRFAHGCSRGSTGGCRGPSIVRIAAAEDARFTVSVDGKTVFPFAVDNQGLVYETGVEPIPEAARRDAANYLSEKRDRIDEKAVLPLALWSGRTFELAEDGKVLKIGELTYDRLDEKERANGLLASQQVALSEAALERMSNIWVATMNDGVERFTTWNTPSVIEVMTNEFRLGGMAFDLPDWFQPSIEEGGGVGGPGEDFQRTPFILMAKLTGTSVACAIEGEYRRAAPDATDEVLEQAAADSNGISITGTEISVSWQTNGVGERVFDCGKGRTTHAKAIAPIIDRFAKLAAEAQRTADSVSSATAEREREASREKRKAEGTSREPSSGSSSSSGSSNRGPASEELKARCALQSDENAYAYFDGHSVDTKAWRQVASQRALQQYIRCINLGR